MPLSHKWSPIENNANVAVLSDGELPALLEVWKDQGAALSAAGAIAKFSEQLSREWAIETGIIERVYAIDRGTTQTLIEKGIEASLIRREGAGRTPEEIAAILQDHLDALEGMFALIKGERDLTVGYIKELHSALMRHVDTYTIRDTLGRFSEIPLVKGAYKTQPNSPTRPDGTVHEYCPPEHVAAEMERLIEIYHQWAQAYLPPEAQAAWLHHAFTQIHPFADGIGRVARTLASLIFVKSGGFPLVIRRDDNTPYIQALEQADQGDLRPLVDLFVRVERRVLLGALQALPRTAAAARENDAHTPEEVIAGIRELLISRGDEQVFPKRWEAVAPLRVAVRNQARNRLSQVAGALGDEITRFKPEFHFSLHVHSETREMDDSMKSVRKVANSLGYELASQGTPEARELRLEPGPYRIVFALHGAGKSYRGVVAGLLAFVSPDGSAHSTTDDVFQFNYKDQQPTVLSRFTEWFEAGLTRALELWRAQI
jgi:Fic family protein